MTAPDEESAARDRVEMWVASGREGDRASLDALCRHYGPLVTLLVRGRLGRRMRRWVEPCDVSQVVLLEFVRGLDTLPPAAGHADVVTRLRRLARWRVVDEVRRHTHRAGESDSPRPMSAVAEDVSSIGTVTHRDDQRWLQAVIASMPDRHRRVLELRAVHGESWEVVSESLGGLSRESARRAYHRIVERLAERLRVRGLASRG